MVFEVTRSQMSYWHFEYWCDRCNRMSFMWSTREAAEADRDRHRDAHAYRNDVPTKISRAVDSQSHVYNAVPPLLEW